MTCDELKRAFMDECPVVCNGITYQCVTAIIYRKTPDGKSVFIQAELKDKCGHAVVIAAADRAERSVNTWGEN